MSSMKTEVSNEPFYFDPLLLQLWMYLLGCSGQTDFIKIKWKRDHSAVVQDPTGNVLQANIQTNLPVLCIRKQRVCF